MTTAVEPSTQSDRSQPQPCVALPELKPPATAPTRAALQLRRTDLDQLLSGSQPGTEDEIEWRLERARLLTDLGESTTARADHLRILEIAPEHRQNLFDLGRLLTLQGHPRAAQLVYEEALKHHPHDAALLVNLGSVLLQQDEPTAARKAYAAALEINPGLPQAHGGMYYSLNQLGEFAAAARHQRLAFGGNVIFECPYRGNGPALPVLLLVSSNGGNTPIEKHLDDEIFQTYVVVADFLHPGQPLPPHRLILNGIGDPDLASHALRSAQKLLSRSTVPLLNHPDAVLQTGRCSHAARLAKIPGLIAAATAGFSHNLLVSEAGPSALLAAGFTFPLLLRVPGFHMGQHFVRVDTPADLAYEVAQLPGAGRPAAELLAIQYLDACGNDGLARKYRVMIVDGQIYPLHLAISPNWKIHYFSADMADRPDHRAEEAAFLEDMPTVLGAKAMTALHHLQTVLALDYGGVDFGLNPQGDLLLFEANATMVFEPPPPDPRWDYRREAVRRIQQAFRDMLLSRCAP